jgi:Cdc6-like AAA superfamily ATPase
MDWEELAHRAGSVFTPASPVTEESLFAGRTAELRRILDAVNQRGQHAIVFGEPGVGKTSLSWIISTKIRRPGTDLLTPRVNCDGADDYTSLWRKVLAEIDLIQERPAIGFQFSIFRDTIKAAETLPNPASPDDIRRMLTLISDSASVIVVIDEFDRIENEQTRRAMADTIKTLSDNIVPATLVLVGVADSVEQLIAEHRSVERALVQIPMPRMSRQELHQVIEKGLDRLGMRIEEEANKSIAILTQGLPHYAHLIGLHSARAALEARTLTVSMPYVEHAIRQAVGDVQHSIRSAYSRAVSSNQSDNIFSHVLLACALARTDSLGYFTASDVCEPLTQVTGKPYETPGFHRHVKQFCTAQRASVLSAKGEARKRRYRFGNPLMQPYIIMQGLIDKRIDSKTLERETLSNF